MKIKGDLTLEQIERFADDEGNLDLRGTGITSLPDGLTVSGSLDLRGTGITSLPDGLTVGGWLDLSDTGITDKKAEWQKVRKPVNGDMRPGRYIYADDIMFPWTGRSHTSGKYTVYIGKIKDQLLVTDGKLWAHCSNLKDGIADILFKEAKDRGADQYKGIDIDKPLTVEELKTVYRVITGACRAGTEAFINQISDLKEKYTVADAIEMTKGQYNASAFARFFGVDQ